MRVTFHGVRGSFPYLAPTTQRYGGNTASAAITVDGEPPLLLDLGTGLPHLDPAEFGDAPRLRATALVTHLHFDHVQGLPFLRCIHEPGTVLDIYGPQQQDSVSLRDSFARLIQPPYFPLSLDEIIGDLRFHEVSYDEFTVGGAKIIARPVPHKGPTSGYRISWDGGTLAYVSDHQAPPTLDKVDEQVLELCEDVDLLIHEAQYTRAEFEERPDWGHCTFEYALLVATQAGARRLCLFHHEPWRTDDDLDALVAAVREAAKGTCVEEVFAAVEGTTLTVGR